MGTLCPYECQYDFSKCQFNEQFNIGGAHMLSSVIYVSSSIL